MKIVNVVLVSALIQLSAMEQDPAKKSSKVEVERKKQATVLLPKDEHEIIVPLDDVDTVSSSLLAQSYDYQITKEMEHKEKDAQRLDYSASCDAIRFSRGRTTRFFENLVGEPTTNCLASDVGAELAKKAAQKKAAQMYISNTSQAYLYDRPYNTKFTEPDQRSIVVSTAPVPKEHITEVLWSHDSTHVATVTKGGVICLWKAATSECIAQLTSKMYAGKVPMQWSVDSSKFAFASKEAVEKESSAVQQDAYVDTVEVWDLVAKEKSLSLKGHSAQVLALTWAPNNSTLISSAYDTTIKGWDTTTGQCRYTLEGHQSPVYVVACSADGSKLFSAADDCTHKIWNLATAKCIVTNYHSHGVYAPVAWSLNSSMIAYSWHNFGMGIEKLDTETSIGFVMERPFYSPERAEFSSDGSELTLYNRNEVGTWDVRSGKKIASIKFEGGLLSRLSPDMTRVAIFARSNILLKSAQLLSISVRQLPDNNKAPSELPTKDVTVGFIVRLLRAQAKEFSKEKAEQLEQIKGLYPELYDQAQVIIKS